MLTREEIRKIIKNSPLMLLLSKLEVESVVEELYKICNQEGLIIIYQNKRM